MKDYLQIFCLRFVSDEKTEAIRRKNNDTVTKPFTLPLQNFNIVKHASFNKLKSPNTREKTRKGSKIRNVDFEINLSSIYQFIAGVGNSFCLAGHIDNTFGLRRPVSETQGLNLRIKFKHLMRSKCVFALIFLKSCNSTFLAN